MDLNLSLSRPQQEIFNACLDPNLRTVSVCGGRKLGKTYCAIITAMAWALQRPNLTIGYFVPSYPYFSSQVKAEAQMLLPPQTLRGGSWDIGYSRTDRVVTFFNGSRILFISMERPDKIRPLSLDALIAEEFSLWNEYTWVDCVQPTLMAKKAKVLAIFTPKLKNHAHMFHNSTEPDHQAFHYTSYDGLVPKAEIERLARSLTDTAFKSEIMAEWLDDMGRVFSNIDNIIDKTIPTHIAPEAGARYVAGIDLGRVDDPTVVTIAHMGRRQGVHQEKFKDIDYVEQAEKIGKILRSYNNAYACIDDTGERGGVCGILKSKGFKVQSVQYNRKTKPALIDNLRIGISDGDFVIPHWHDTYEELAVYDIQETKGGHITYNAPYGYHDDHVNSLALMYKAMKKRGSRAIPTLIPRERSIDSFMSGLFKRK